MPLPKLSTPPRPEEPGFFDWVDLMYRHILALQAGSVSNDSAMSAARAADLTDGGETALHFHASDRARANHTGTQLAETISDFATAVAGFQHNDHATLNNLSWLASGHTGTLNTIPAFSAAGWLSSSRRPAPGRS